MSTATETPKNVWTSSDIKAPSEPDCGSAKAIVPLRDPASNRTYLCPTCGVFFPTSAARSLHRRQVHQRHHLCQTCDKAFPTSQKLERHLKTHVKSEKKIKQDSDLCPKEFSTEENLESHLKNPFGIECHQEYFTGSRLSSQREQVYCNETHYKCPTCEFVGNTYFEFELHSETDHPGTLITSKGFNQQFIDNTELLRSQSTEPHSNEEGSECPVHSLSSEELQTDIQMKSHTITKKHTCAHCGHKFAFKNSLTKHLSKGRCIILKKFPNKT